MLEMRGITKSFPGGVALEQVDFSLNRGEVHALLGENGAGKSTLMKILAGMYRADSGIIRIHNRLVDIGSPQEALKHGVAMVYQNFSLSPELTVYENIVLGTPLSFFLKPQELMDKINLIVSKYGMEVDLEAKVWQLSVGEQQRVEIIKCFYRGASILILDEPTAVLTPDETLELFKMIRRIVEDDCTVIFISHKLNEVLSIADRVTVLRKGKKTCELSTKDCSVEDLSHAMIGRHVDLENTCRLNTPESLAMSIKHLNVLNDKLLPAVRDVSFDLRAGEIFGIAAISGNGQAELAESITGLRSIQSGTIELAGGQEVHNMSISEIIDAGIAHISEKRLGRSLVPDLSVAGNLIIKDFKRFPFSRFGILRKNVIKEYAQKMIDRFGIAAATPSTAVRSLSGGNLQKVVIAREVSRDSKVLIAVNPTYGLDIGAIEFVQTQMLEQRNAGTSILLVSEELDEILRLSDRIAVMSKGKIVGIFHRDDCTKESIGMLMTRGEESSND